MILISLRIFQRKDMRGFVSGRISEVLDSMIVSVEGGSLVGHFKFPSIDWFSQESFQDQKTCWSCTSWCWRHCFWGFLHRRVPSGWSSRWSDTWAQERVRKKLCLSSSSISNRFYKGMSEQMLFPSCTDLNHRQNLALESTVTIQKTTFLQRGFISLIFRLDWCPSPQKYVFINASKEVEWDEKSQFWKKQRKKEMRIKALFFSTVHWLCFVLWIRDPNPWVLAFRKTVCTMRADVVLCVVMALSSIARANLDKWTALSIEVGCRSDLRLSCLSGCSSVGRMLLWGTWTRKELRTRLWSH